MVQGELGLRALRVYIEFRSLGLGVRGVEFRG